MDDSIDLTDAAPGSKGLQSDFAKLGLQTPTTSTESDQKVLEEIGVLKYDVSHDKRGKAIVINNFKFAKSTGMPERKGADVDCRSVVATFQYLEFDVDVAENRSANEMLAIMTKAGEKVDHANHDCFACIIMSHGEEGTVWGTDAEVDIDDLLAPFKGCSTLGAKPKLFFFQCCRGKAFDDGMDVADSACAGDGNDQMKRIPVEADFLMVYSVPPGFYSWRNTERGSWFIEELCKVLLKYGNTMEIMQLLARVNYMVAYQKESRASTSAMSKKKQIPCVVSMLTKELFFPCKHPAK